MTIGDKFPSRKTGSRLALLAIVVALAWPLGAAAQVNLEITIGTPPPPVRVEVVPAPRPGYVWAPGYWAWDGHRHVWYRGHWEAERRDQHYIAAHWVDGPHGWHFAPAHWEHVERMREHHHDEFCPPGQARKGRC